LYLSLQDVKKTTIIQNPDVKVITNNAAGTKIISKHGYDLDYSTQIGYIAKKVSDDSALTLQQRAEVTHSLKELQSEMSIFPYDRYIKTASDHKGEILSRTENIKSKKKHYIWNVNHYLGMNRHPEVIEYAKQCIEKYGTGSGTSMVSGGMNELHRAIEQFFSYFWNKEESIIFPTGYAANLGAISGLVGSKDLVLFDKECHASIIDGIKLSKAKFIPFRHNNVDDLEKKVNRYSKDYETVLVIAESVYSMSGTEAPLRDYVELKKNKDFLLFIDEAHSFGFYGKDGRGYCDEMGCLADVDVVMTTLSKSAGSLGGIISCNKELATYIQFNSSPYIFQACISPADAGAVLKSLEILSIDSQYRDSLWSNTRYLRKKLKAAGFDYGDSTSPLVPIYVENPKILALLCREIFEQGIFTNWAAYPAVGLNEGRLRFIVSSNHTKRDIDQTVKILSEAYKKVTV